MHHDLVLKDMFVSRAECIRMSLAGQEQNGWKVKVKACNGPVVQTLKAGAPVYRNSNPSHIQVLISHIYFEHFVNYQGEFQ